MAAPYLAATSGQPPLAQHIDQFLISHATTYLYTGTQQGGQTTLGSGSAATNGLYLAQSFTAGSSFSLGRVVLTLALTGAPVPTTVSIQTSSAGAPSGTVLVSTSLPPAMVPASAATVSIPVPCTLTSGTTYWIVVAAAGDASDFYAWSKSNQTSGASTSTNGSTWTAQAYGFYYALYDQSAVLPLVHAYDDAGARWSTLAWSAGQLTALQEYTVGQTAASPATSSVALSYSGGALTTVAAAGTTPAAPVWSAPHNGLIADASATAGAAQINQFLTSHGIQAVYTGNTVLFPQGNGGTIWAQQLSTQDVSQPFTMSGTVIGRVGIPILAVGDGADLLVSLCADNAGTPGTVIQQTRVPASWIYQLSAVSGTRGAALTPPQLTATGNPLALAQFNILFTGALSPGSWPLPAGTDGSYVAAWAITGNDSYLILLGGTSLATSVAQTSAFTVAVSPDGTMAAAVPQPAMPTANIDGGATVMTDPVSGDQTVFIAGGWGANTAGSPALTLVYGAQLDTATGTLSSWTAQTPLHTATGDASVVSANGYLYVIGGTNGARFSGGTALTLVQYAQVQNGQVVSWSTTTPLPVPPGGQSAWAADGYVYVNASDQTGVNIYLWYAVINDDGTLGTWITGPTPPALLDPLVAGDAGAYAGGPSVSAGPDGPDVSWQFQGDPSTNAGVFLAANGDGMWQYYGVDVFTPPSTIVTSPLALTPRVSVPLPATGLTNGATYHILMQQMGGDEWSYLCTHWDTDSFPGNPTALASPSQAYTWSALAPAGTDIPIQVWDGAPLMFREMPLHLWSDRGARVTTFVNATTPDRRPLGICEATRQAVALNTNQGFEAGITPWTWSGGTAVQSNIEVYQGQYAARVTPSGTDATVYLQSENLPCMPGQSVTVTGWMWFTSAVTSNASMSVNWFDLTGAYLSTSSNNVSVAAATWTHLSNAFTAPAGAHGFTMCPALSGTPSASQVFYVDAARAHYTYTGPQNATVMAVEYAGTYPWPWPGLGTRQLA